MNSASLIFFNWRRRWYPRRTCSSNDGQSRLKPSFGVSGICISIPGDKERRRAKSRPSSQVDGISLLAQPVKLGLQGLGYDVEFSGDAYKPPHALFSEESFRLSGIPVESLPARVWVDPLITTAYGVAPLNGMRQTV